jgi:shikimate kinase
MTDETGPPLNPATLLSGPLSAIALVGFMGAGKTTVGQALASRLGWQFVDLDELIQQREGRTIQQIFEQSGESAFRQLELEALKIALRQRRTGTVLSLGGGAFVDNTNQELLRDNGVPAVFLDTPAEELFRRCSQPGTVRPLARDRERFCELYELRRPAYMSATFRIQTANREIEMIVEEIITAAGLHARSGAEQ